MNSLRVALSKWGSSGAHDAIREVLLELNCQVSSFDPCTEPPCNANLILSFGPGGSLLLVSRWLATRDPRTRPVFALWHIETLPSPSTPEWIWRLGGVARSRLEKLRFDQPRLYFGLKRSRLWRRLWAVTFRYRNYGEVLFAKKQGFLDILAVSSPVHIKLFSDKGLRTIAAPFGSHSSLGKDLAIDRNIPVLWIGWPGSRRRKSMLNRVQKKLSEKGIQMVRIEGDPVIHGMERTVLLNRSVIVLNLLKQPWDSNSFRYYLAAANGALIVTEPTLPHSQFESGKHLVTAKIADLADTIEYYLSHDQERAEIVRSARKLVTEKVLLSKGVSRILLAAKELLP